MMSEKKGKEEAKSKIFLHHGMFIDEGIAEPTFFVNVCWFMLEFFYSQATKEQISCP